jgi:hypothetical protein
MTSDKSDAVCSRRAFINRVPINGHDIGMHPCAGTKVSGASDDRLNIYDSEALGALL